MAKLRYGPRVNRSRLVSALLPFPTDVYGVLGAAALWLLFRKKKGAPEQPSAPTSAPPREP
jgi:hypothetical protein